MAGSADFEDGDLGFQIAPMVDVVFVLILFFMAAAGMQQVEKELSINLSGGTSTAANSDVPKTPIIITISAEGAVEVNGQSFDGADSKDLAGTRDKLKELMSFGTKDPVIIQPAPEARQEQIVKVLSAAAAAGVQNLSFS